MILKVVYNFLEDVSAMSTINALITYLIALQGHHFIQNPDIQAVPDSRYICKCIKCRGETFMLKEALQKFALLFSETSPPLLFRELVLL
jgi:hypothetical protein